MRILIHILFLKHLHLKNFFYTSEKTVFENEPGYNCATVSSITRKILECDMESRYMKASRIRNFSFIFQN